MKRGRVGELGTALPTWTHIHDLFEAPRREGGRLRGGRLEWLATQMLLRNIHGELCGLEVLLS